MGKKIEGEDTKETKKMCDVLTNIYKKMQNKYVSTNTSYDF
jgi:hypothetical protein